MNNLSRERRGSEESVATNQSRGGFFQNLFPTLSNPPSILNENSPSKKKSIFTVTSTMGVINVACNGSETRSSDLVSLAAMVHPRNPEVPGEDSEGFKSQRISGSDGLNRLDGFLSPKEGKNFTRSPGSGIPNTNEECSLSESHQLDVITSTCSPLNRHDSLENLHHPRNHRSTAKKGTRKKSDSKKRRKQLQTRTALGRQTFESDEGLTQGVETHPLGEILSSSGDCSLKEKDWERRCVLLSRASTAFALGAVRRLRREVDVLTEDNKKKTRESAARLILHNLLLNSWRQCLKQSDKVGQENNLHLRTIENMCLQLRVLRQMHREEKERSQSRNIEISELSIQISTLKRDADSAHSELEKVETELNGCQVQVEGLQNHNNLLKAENERLNQSIISISDEKYEELQKLEALEKKNTKLLDEISQFKKQVQELTKSRNTWQEEARSRDSEIISLKTDLSNKDKHIQQLQISHQDLQRELFRSHEFKLKLQLEEQQMLLKISQSKDQIQTLSESLIKSDEKLDVQHSEIETLTKTIETQQCKLSRIQEDLSIYLREGIERRKKWANSFHYLVFPFDILSLIYETSQEQSRYAVNLKDITMIQE